MRLRANVGDGGIALPLHPVTCSCSGEFGGRFVWFGVRFVRIILITTVPFPSVCSNVLRVVLHINIAFKLPVKRNSGADVSSAPPAVATAALRLATTAIASAAAAAAAAVAFFILIGGIIIDVIIGGSDAIVGGSVAIVEGSDVIVGGSDVIVGANG